MNLTLALLLALVPGAIAGMGSPSWRVRERSMATLYHLAPVALPALVAAEKGGHPERARRAALLLDRYHADNADSMSRVLTNLPPIGLLGGAARGLDMDDAWHVWRAMVDCLWRAHANFGYRQGAAVCWVLNDGSSWGFTDPLDVQREATRLYLIPIIARRGDVRAALLPLYREAICRGQILWRSK